MNLRLIFISLLVSATALLPSAQGQTLSGEVAVVDTNPPCLLRVTGSGSTTTQLGPLLSSKIFTTAVNRTNTGVVTVVTHTATGHFAVLDMDDSGIGTTLASGGYPLMDVTAVTVDQRGDYLLLNNGRNNLTTGIFRLDVMNQLTTVASNFGMVNPLAMAEDPGSGDLVALDALGRFYRITRGGGITVLSTQIRPVQSMAALRSNPGAAGLLGAWSTGLHRISLTPFSITTLTTPPPPFRAMGLDADFETHTMVVTSTPIGAATSKLFHFDETGSLLSTVAQIPGPLVGCAWMKKRHLFGCGTLGPGLPYSLGFSFPGEQGRSYLAAASFGHAPGFKVSGVTVPLDPDPLFFLSLSSPLMFTGFHGMLNTWGLGSGTIFLPGEKALKGVRFFVAVVVYDVTGVRRVSGPLGLTIE